MFKLFPYWKFINYTSYDKGINGIIVDIENPLSSPTLADFVFRVGNDDDPDGWVIAPAASRYVVRPREGVNQSTRVEIGWDDSVIQNQWLQVTVLANRSTALPQDDVFYFGNAPGDTGDSSANARVNSNDATT